MIKIPKLRKPKKTPKPVTFTPIPQFHRISQLLNNGTLHPLFPKPTFCTQSKGLELGLSKCNPEGNLITIEVKALDPAGQKIAMLEATESDLTKYTGEN